MTTWEEDLWLYLLMFGQDALVKGMQGARSGKLCGSVKRLGFRVWGLGFRAERCSHRLGRRVLSRSHCQI